MPVADIPADLFWSSVDIRGDAECWPWLGKMTHGYGYMNFGGKSHRAYRVSLLLRGTEIPRGLFADHMCRNKACVNPAHLRVVTPRINSIENSDGFAAVNAAKTMCASGHPLSGGNLYVRPNGWRTCLECARVARRRWRARHATAFVTHMLTGKDG